MHQLILFHFNNAFAKAPLHQCDTLAGHPDDPNLIGEGVEWDDLVLYEDAIKLCLLDPVGKA